TIKEVYVSQPPGFVDPEFPDKVYKVEKALYGLHQAPKAWYETLSTYLIENGFRRGIIDKTLFIKKIKNDILLVQVVKSASTTMETHKPLSKDADGTDVDVHLYRFQFLIASIGVHVPLFESMLVHDQHGQDEGPTIPIRTQHTPTVIEPSPQLRNISNTYRKTWTRTIRIGIRIPHSNVLSSVADEAIIKEMHDGLGRATTTASSLEVEQGSGNISKTQTKATPSKPSSPRTNSEGGPGKQGEVHETTEHIMESNVDFSTASSQNDDDEQTLVETLVNIKRSAEKDKDLDEALAQKLQVEELAKSTARQEQEQYDFEKALELQKKLDESEEVVAKSSQAYDINWSDTVVIRYHAIQNRFFSKAEKRKASTVREDKGKRQKKQDDPKKLTLMKYVEVISDSKEIINVTPLAVKFLIVGWKSYCKVDVGDYKIHRADRSYNTYIFFSQMLNDFDKEDLIGLYRLFSEKYASTRPSFDDLMLWGDIKIMFEPNKDDAVWKNHHSQELIEWRLYDSCRVHSLMLEEVSIHMLVEKKYPLPQDTLTRMLRWKLHVNYNITEMAYELLRLIRS
ncbi:putative ribonuclease H-like domain-containing protein, partial [Tanacetum coccineum]